MLLILFLVHGTHKLYVIPVHLNLEWPCKRFTVVGRVNILMTLSQSNCVRRQCLLTKMRHHHSRLVTSIHEIFYVVRIGIKKNVSFCCQNSFDWVRKWINRTLRIISIQGSLSTLMYYWNSSDFINRTRAYFEECSTNVDNCAKKSQKQSFHSQNRVLELGIMKKGSCICSKNSYIIRIVILRIYNVLLQKEHIKEESEYTASYIHTHA